MTFYKFDYNINLILTSIKASALIDYIINYIIKNNCS